MTRPRPKTNAAGSRAAYARTAGVCARWCAARATRSPRSRPQTRRRSTRRSSRVPPRASRVRRRPPRSGSGGARDGARVVNDERREREGKRNEGKVRLPLVIVHKVLNIIRSIQKETCFYTAALANGYSSISPGPACWTRASRCLRSSPMGSRCSPPARHGARSCRFRNDAMGSATSP